MNNALKQLDMLDTGEFAAILSSPPGQQVRAPRPMTGAPSASVAVQPMPARAPMAGAARAVATAPTPMMHTARPALVIGGTGAFGGGLAFELLTRGEPVRVLSRSPQRAWHRFGSDPNLRLVEGDARSGDAVVRAAEGCDIIIHGANYPPHRWGSNLEAVTVAVIEAARRNNSTIVFPGNVLGLGPQTDRPLREDAPNRAAGHKGQLRIRLEGLLQQAAAGGRCKVVILRSGDLFGPTVRNSTVDGIFAHALAGQPMLAYGDLKAAHEWAFMPDLARVAADIIRMARREYAFDSCEIVNFAGHLVRPQRSFYRMVAEAAGRPDLPIARRPWLGMRISGLWRSADRELLELRYLYDRTVILDDSKLHRLFPRYEHTPIADAIKATLDSYRYAAS